MYRMKEDSLRGMDNVKEKQAAEEDEKKLENMPSNFMCPISLEPMSDPVTLATGQTYERVNIHRWISEGHNTCPSTMQQLRSPPVLTPNHALRHLIHDWYLTNSVLHKKKPSFWDQVEAAGNALKSSDPHSVFGALQRISQILQQNDLTRTICVDQGLPELFISFLDSSSPLAVQNEVVSILVLLPLDSASKSKLAEVTKLSVLGKILKDAGIEERINVAKLTEILAMAEDLGFHVGRSFNFLGSGILDLIQDERDDTVLVGLSCLRAICASKMVRPMVVQMGFVLPLVHILSFGSRECIEIAVSILELLCSSAEGRAALQEQACTIPSLVGVLRRVSDKSTHHAMSVLWAVCKSWPEETALEAVKAGAPTKLLLIIQGGCNPVMKQRCSELLKLLSQSYHSSTFIFNSDFTQTIH